MSTSSAILRPASRHLFLRSILAACLVTLLCPASAAADSHSFESQKAVKIDDVGGGELLRRTATGFLPLPNSKTDVEITITGIMSRGTLTQTFTNPHAEVIEAIYVFPLPEDAAVQHMEILVGDRRIVSVVKERTQAKKTYEKAKAEGKKAALVEQERPNLFTTTVANINTGESVEVVLEYVEEVDYEDGRFSVTFPLTFTPRFVPDARLAVSESTGEVVVASTVVHDADRVTPPFQESFEPSAPSATFRAHVNGGVPIRDLESPSHAMRVRSEGEGWTIRPEAEWILADRDVVLRWSPRVGTEPEIAFVTENADDGTYGLLMMVPPTVEAAATTGLATQTLFVIDVSGSMAGPSIEQAREALMEALDRLGPADSFNILRFNDDHSLFARAFQPADPVTVGTAKGWVRGLTADGGTMIYPALLRGISEFTSAPENVVRRIVFLTDGAVANEAQMLERIAAGLGGIRLHTIGIGHAPNRYLMRKLASLGGGLCEFVADTGAAENEIDVFFSRLQRPVMTDVQLEWEGATPTDLYPVTPADLHAGEPLFTSFRLPVDAAVTQVTLRARTSTGIVVRTFELPASARESGIATRWARAKVAALMDGLFAGSDPEQVRADVVAVGLAHHLVTRYTSLVAVEEVVSAKGPAHRARVANALPHGSQLLSGALPKGGTDGPLRIWIGAILAAAGALVLLIWRRSDCGDGHARAAA